MGLSLSDTEYLYRERGELYRRTYAACGLLAYSLLTENPAPNVGLLAWAKSMVADPDKTAFGIYKGVAVHPSTQALDAEGLRSGATPTDATLTALVSGLVTAFFTV